MIQTEKEHALGMLLLGLPKRLLPLTGGVCGCDGVSCPGPADPARAPAAWGHSGLRPAPQPVRMRRTDDRTEGGRHCTGCRCFAELTVLNGVGVIKQALRQPLPCAPENPGLQDGLPSGEDRGRCGSLLLQTRPVPPPWIRRRHAPHAKRICCVGFPRFGIPSLV